MHQWLHDNRFLLLLFCLPAMGWSCFLYLRAYRTWEESRKRPLRRRRSPVAAKSKPAEQKSSAGPLPRTTSIKGEQSDLLSGIDQQREQSEGQQKAYQSTHIIRPSQNKLAPSSRDTAPRPSEIIRQLQNREPDEGIQQEAEAAEIPAGEGAPEEFSTTDKFRTTRTLQAVHEAGAPEAPGVDEDDVHQPTDDQAAEERDEQVAELEAQVEEAADSAGVDVPTWLAEQEAMRQVPLEPPPGLSESEREQWRQDQLGLRKLADEYRRTAAPLPQEPATGRAIHRGYKPPSQAAVSAMEKAQRLEELGLHFGIPPRHGEAATDDEQLRANSEVASGLSDEQQARLSELGLTDEDDRGTDGGDQRRMVTEELDGILARLDAALDEDEQVADPSLDHEDEQATTSDVDRAIDDALDEVLGDAEDQIDDEDDDAVDELIDRALGEPEDQDRERTSEAEDDERSAPSSSPGIPSWARVDTFDDDQSTEDDGVEDEEDDDDDEDSGKQQSLFE